QAAHYSAHASCQPAHRLITDNDRRLQVIVSRNALSRLLVGARSEFARVTLFIRNVAQAAFRTVVTDGRQDEAIGLLNSQSYQRLDGGYFRGLSEAGKPLLSATVVHSQGAQRRIATLQ